MSTVFGNELVLLNLLTLAFIVAVLLPSPAFRIILGVPVLLLAPGYSLVVAIFPRNKGPDTLERIGLSFGLSIAVVPIIGLFLKLTPWGLALEPVLYSVSSFVFITSIIAWLRRRRLTDQERFRLNIHLKALNWKIDKRNIALSVVLIVTIAGALGMLAYVIATPAPGERFTEFYIVGTGGKAAEYPVSATLGNRSEVTVGIVNREREIVDYQLEVSLDGLIVAKEDSIVLANGQKWEQQVGFIPDKVGDKQRVELRLYKDGEVEPYRNLYFLIDVSR